MSPTIAALVLGQMLFTAFLLFLVAGFIRDRARRRSELQMRLLDRFGSAPEFLAFLEGEGGRTLRDAIMGRRFAVAGQVLGTVQLGIVLTALGGGLLVASVRQGDGDLMVAAAVCGAVGLGLVVAALVAQRLSVRWNVWRDEPPREG